MKFGLKILFPLLHCNTEYPTPMKDVNLKAMLSIQKYFGVQVGYSIILLYWSSIAAAL
jgi:sialic acid synthase SpsE